MQVPRKVWIAIAGLGGAALLFWMFRPEATPVEVARVTRGGLRETIAGEGKTRVHDRYVIGAPITGRLQRLSLRAGDSVTAGQVLGWVAPAPLDTRARREAEAQVAALEDALQSTEAAALAARAALAQASRERARADSLARGGNLSAAGLEAAVLEETTRRRAAEAATARADAARHDVERARAALAASDAGAAPALRTVLRAPAGGRVFRVLEENNRVVAAGTPLLELGDLRGIEAVADLLTTDAVRVHPGDTVLVEAWGGGAPLRGTVRLVEPSGFTKVSALGVEEQRVNVIATLLDPPGTLGDRYRVEVRIVLWGAGAVLRLPESALVRADSGWVAYAVEGGRLRSRPVQVGHRGDEAVEIVGGLGEGAVVVRHPDGSLRPGERVRAVAAD